jgi:hypothetical protein
VSEFRRYVTRVETRVIIVNTLSSGREVAVGEFTVVTEEYGDSQMQHPVKHMLTTALARQVKKVHTMGAAVQNNENNRLK